MRRLLYLIKILFFVFCFRPHQGFAQEAWDMTLEELVNAKVVSASRQEDTALKVPSVVTIVTGEELARWGAENLADGLRTVAGMQVLKSTADFPQYSVTVRGNSADFMNIRTLFLIDGVAVRNPNAGFDPGWIPLTIIKRVEIVKGPASSLYGANAFGGIVNVITKNAQDMSPQDGKIGFEAGLGYRLQKDVVKQGNVGGTAGHLNLGREHDAFDYFASAQYSNRENSNDAYPGHQYQDVFGKLRYQFSDQVEMSTTALLSYDRNQVSLANADSPIRNDFSHLAHSVQFKLDANSKLNIVGHLSDFKHFLPYTDALDRYDNHGRVYGFNAQYSARQDKDHAINLGIEFAEESGSLETKENDYSVFPPMLKTAGWDKKTQSTYGVYSQYDYLGWDKYIPVVGIRYDKNSVYGSALSPRVALSYLSNENTTYYASIGRGFRSPVFNETDIQGFGKVGNSKLRPEYTTTYEVGVKSVQLNTQNTASLFREEVSEKIDLETVSGSTLKTYTNSGTASISGIEIDGAYRALSRLRLFYNTTLLRTETNSGKRIERVVEQKFVLGFNWAFLEKWSSDFAVNHQSDHFFYNANASIPSDSQGRYFLPSLTTANLQIKHELSANTSAALFIDNLTDKTYKEVFSPFIIQDGLYLPGRTIGLKFNAQW